MIDLFTADFDNLQNDARYSAIAEFARAQPVESYRHDFKTDWANDTLKDVAALANTFGGVLILGVAKGQTDHEARLDAYGRHADMPSSSSRYRSRRQEVKSEMGQ